MFQAPLTVKIVGKDNYPGTGESIIFWVKNKSSLSFHEGYYDAETHSFYEAITDLGRTENKIAAWAYIDDVSKRIYQKIKKGED